MTIEHKVVALRILGVILLLIGTFNLRGHVFDLALLASSSWLLLDAPDWLRRAGGCPNKGEVFEGPKEEYCGVCGSPILRHDPCPS